MLRNRSVWEFGGLAENAAKMIEDFVSQHFNDTDGMPRAYMEFPQRDGGPHVRVVYESVVFSYRKTNGLDYNFGALVDAVCDSMKILSEEANGLDGRIPYLYWRARPQFEDGDEFLTVKMRIGVLTPVSLTQVVHENNRGVGDASEVLGDGDGQGSRQLQEEKEAQTEEASGLVAQTISGLR